MKKADEEIIAAIVAHAIEDHDAKLEEKSREERKLRHIKRRVVIVSTLAVGVVLTHHYTHIEPIGKFGELAASTLITWFFEKGSRAA